MIVLLKKILSVVISVLLFTAFDGNAQDINKIVSKDYAFTTFSQDSVEIRMQVNLNAQQQPINYSSWIETPVCADSLCHLVLIHLYWDILGNFYKYELPADRPLTKFDHEEFTRKDHDKLYEILANTESPLRDYKKDDLIDQNVKLKSEVADAVSGATNAGIKEDIIEGALYSTYTLWHIVNGPIAREILKRTESGITPQILNKMLHSDSHQEQFYALTRLDSDQLSNSQVLLELILKGKAYVPLFAVQKLQAASWNLPEYQEKLLSALPAMSFELQNEIINKLSSLKLTPTALAILKAKMKLLTSQQQQKIIKLIQP